VKLLLSQNRGKTTFFLVEYGEELKPQGGSNNARIDYREILNQQEYVLFDRLRELRKTISEKQGVPVYAIFTNEQLAAMVKTPPTALGDFHAINGVGEGRVKNERKPPASICEKAGVGSKNNSGN